MATRRPLVVINGALAQLQAGDKLPADAIQEVIALADLTDVAGVTGTGTTVVLSTGPTIDGALTLSATGPGFLRQATPGAPVTVAPLVQADLPSPLRVLMYERFY